MINIAETLKMVIMITGSVSMITVLWMTMMYYMMEE